MIEEKLWLSEVKQTKDTKLIDFARTVEPIDIDLTEDVKGDVLVGGHYIYFVERTLVCTPESDFKALKPNVASLTLCDESVIDGWRARYNNFYITPKVQKCDYSLVAKGIKLLKSRENPQSVDISLKNLLQRLPECFFDTILFFRVPALGKQLKDEGLGAEIARSLKPGGKFIGSGSIAYYSEDIRDPNNCLEGLELTNLVELNNPDFDKWTYYPNHLGFIFQKTGF